MLNTQTKMTAEEIGTVSHKYLELLLKKKNGQLVTDDDKYKASKSYEEEVEPFLDDEIIETVRRTANNIQISLDNIKAVDNNASIHIEEYVYLLNRRRKPDVYTIFGEDLLIIDLKTGKSFERYDTDDVQFLEYAAAIMMKHEHINYVTIEVIQADKHKRETYDRETIKEWYHRYESNELQKKVEEAGEDSLAAQMYLLNRQLQTLDDDDIEGELLKAIKELESTFSTIFKTANKQAGTGKQFEHFNYKGRMMTKYASEEELEEFITNEGYSIEDLNRTKKIQAGRMKKLLTAEQQEKMKEMGLKYKKESPKKLKLIK